MGGGYGVAVPPNAAGGLVCFLLVTMLASLAYLAKHLLLTES